MEYYNIYIYYIDIIYIIYIYVYISCCNNYNHNVYLNYPSNNSNSISPSTVPNDRLYTFSHDIKERNIGSNLNNLNSVNNRSHNFNGFESNLYSKMNNLNDIVVGIVVNYYKSPKYPNIVFQENEEVLILEIFDRYYMVEKESGVRGFIPKEYIKL